MIRPLKTAIRDAFAEALSRRLPEFVQHPSANPHDSFWPFYCRSSGELTCFVAPEGHHDKDVISMDLGWYLAPERPPLILGAFPFMPVQGGAQAIGLSTLMPRPLRGPWPIVPGITFAEYLLRSRELPAPVDHLSLVNDAVNRVIDFLLQHGMQYFERVDALHAAGQLKDGVVVYPKSELPLTPSRQESM